MIVSMLWKETMHTHTRLIIQAYTIAPVSIDCTFEQDCNLASSQDHGKVENAEVASNQTADSGTSSGMIQSLLNLNRNDVQTCREKIIYTRRSMAAIL